MEHSSNLIATQDGSLTLFDAGTHQHYHNRAGAYTESLKNYVLPSGVLEWGIQQGRVALLDVCYGLGYNAWTLVEQLLLTQAALENPQPLSIEIHAIELNAMLFQHAMSLLQQPCYAAINQAIAPHKACLENFFSTITQQQQTAHYLTLSFEHQVTLQFHVYTQDLRQTVPIFAEQHFDLIFHDPFSPNKMPELWTVDLFQQYHRILNLSGQMLTYSLAAAVRAGLLEAGFALMKSEAVGDKPGGTIAFVDAICIPDNRNLSPAFTESEHAYLQTRAGIPYRDQDLQQDRENILSQRTKEQDDSKRPTGHKKYTAAIQA